MPNIGAHKSTAGGPAMAVKRLGEIGGTCLQIFSKSPRTWQATDISADQVTDFKNSISESGVGPVYFHAPYLINLASENDTSEKSVEVLTAELKAAADLGVEGSVIHLGSYKGDESDEHYDRLIKNIKRVLKNTPPETKFIIENMGTRKIGMKLEEIGSIIRDVASDRLKVCLDTCHLHASSYDITTSDKLEKFLKNFDDLIGLDRLEVVHVNDSKDPFGSLRDRHENINEGHVGEGVFVNLLSNPKTRDLPFILETPGFDDEGPDRANVLELQRLAS